MDVGFVKCLIFSVNCVCAYSKAVLKDLSCASAHPAETGTEGGDEIHYKPVKLCFSLAHLFHRRRLWDKSAETLPSILASVHNTSNQRMDGRLDGRMGGRMDGRLDRFHIGQTDIQIPVHSSNMRVLLTRYMTLGFVCICVKQGGRGGWWECMLSSESKRQEKERADSGPVMCFNTRTGAGRQPQGRTAGE